MRDEVAQQALPTTADLLHGDDPRAVTADGDSRHQVIHERDAPASSLLEEDITWSEAVLRSTAGRQATCQEQIGCISFVQGVLGLGARQANDDLLAGGEEGESLSALDRSPEDIDRVHASLSAQMPPKDEWDSIGFTDRTLPHN